MTDYLLGIDGGGTGTRALLADARGRILGRGEAGPSALAQGIPSAWREILLAASRAFEAAQVPPDWSRCAMGAGLSGATHGPWRLAFAEANPGFARLMVETDAFTMLLGAHAGAPGVVVAAGTGSVGEAWYPDGTRRSVGGWGFPVGDEGSGAWLGLRALAHAQAALDGRAAPGALARAIQARCGTDRETVLSWCAQAGQAAYASLAPAIFEAEAEDLGAARLLQDAVVALENTAQALDPGQTLPLALAGSVAIRLADRLAPRWQARRVMPAGGPEAGALALIAKAVRP